MDRIYISKLFSSIKDNFTYASCFSDHLCVCVTLDINTQVQIARPRWRLNVFLLQNENVQSNFYRVWSFLLERKRMFSDIIQWWEVMVKPQLKQYYINQGKEQKNLKQGLLRYLENNLRSLYDNANHDNTIDYDMMHTIKNRIDSIKD